MDLFLPEKIHTNQSILLYASLLPNYELEKKMKIKYALSIIFLIFSIYSFTMADTQNESDNQTEGTILNNMEYPQMNSSSIELPLLSQDMKGKSASGGRLGSQFSGSSIIASGSDQSPAVIITFSDKSSVSGNITNFVKSFNYESGISPWI
jgi:hypothetical protein